MNYLNTYLIFLVQDGKLTDSKLLLGIIYFLNSTYMSFLLLVIRELVSPTNIIPIFKKILYC